MNPHRAPAKTTTTRMNTLAETNRTACSSHPWRVVVSNSIETSTPANTPVPIGPYNHIAKVGPFISIGGTAGVDPATGQLPGPDVETQTRQILNSFRVMLQSVGSDLDHVLHINIFLLEMKDFDAMNRAYV